MITRKENIKAACNGILSDEYVENIKGYFIEEVADDLEDEWGSIIAGRQGPYIVREHKLLEDVPHGCYVMNRLLFLK